MSTDRLVIEALKLEAFGHFRDLSLTPSPRLTLFYGPNEAGKSTILGFVRAMLFGLEKRSTEGRYTPEEGEHAGRMTLSGPLGRLEVRRSFAKKGERELSVLGAGDERLGAAQLETSLGGISREMFCEVFGFSLKELGTFERLAAQDGVSEALLTAGLRGAKRLRSARETLQKDASKIFAPRATNPELNQLLKRLEKTRADITSRGDRPAQYFATLERRDQTLLTLAADREERSRQERQVGQLRRRRDALPLLQEWMALRVQVQSAREQEFPLGGLERLEDIATRLERTVSDLKALETQLQVLEAARGAAAPPVDLDGVERAADEYLAIRSQARELPARKAHLEARRQELARQLEAIGFADAPASLEQRVFPPARRSLLRAQGEALRERLGLRREAKAAWDAARAAALEAEGQIRSVEARLQGREGSSSLDLEEQRVACGQMTAAQRECAEASSALQAAQAAHESLPELRPWAAWAMWGWEALSLGVAVMAALPLGTAARWVAGGLGLLGLVLGPWLAGRSQRLARTRSAERERWSSMEQNLSRRLETAHETLERLALLAGIAVEASEVELRERESLLIRETVEARAREADLQARESCRQALARCQETLERLERDWQDASSAAQEQGMRWENLLREEQLAPSLEPEEALEVWARTAELRQRSLELTAELTRLAQEEQTVAHASSVLAGAAANLGWPGQNAESLLARLRTAQESERAAQDRRRLQDEKERLLTAQRVGKQGDRDAAQTQLFALLERAGCEDAVEFRARAEEARGHALARQRFDALAGQVQALVGVPCEGVLETLDQGGGEEGLRRTLAESEAALAALGVRVEEAMRSNGELEHQLKGWAQDSEIQSLRSDEEALKSRIEELSSRWAVDQLALHLLDRAQEVFRAEQQPRLLQRASEHLWTLTRGRYRKVRVLEDGREGLQVLDGQNREQNAETLSRGTCEQLYLAFRLAVVEDLCTARPALPLVLDDIWVNFDPGRAELAVELFARMAERHQVMALTCHPWVRALFEAQGAEVIELQGVQGQLGLLRPDLPSQVLRGAHGGRLG